MSNFLSLRLATISLLIILTLDFLPTGQTCFRREAKNKENSKQSSSTTTESPEPRPSLQQFAAKYKKPGFYLQIEENLDGEVRVTRYSSKPRMLSQLAGGEDENSAENKNMNVEVFDENGEVETESLASASDDNTQSPQRLADIQVQSDWGGDCDNEYWMQCSKLQRILVPAVYEKIVGRDAIPQDLDLDCVSEKPLCMRNGWTANRCHLLCMSKCNKDILQGWEKFVGLDTPCKYI